jgi:hypothetical protein
VNLTIQLYLLPTSRMRGAIPKIPQYVIMVWYLVKHRDFTLTFFTCCIWTTSPTVLIWIFATEFCV